MIPVVSVRSSPNGLPIANTRWPTRKSLDDPNVTGTSSVAGAATLSHGHVGGRVVPTIVCGLMRRPVVEQHLNFLGPLHDVKIGEHVAAGLSSTMPDPRPSARHFEQKQARRARWPSCRC